jgi:hypothetical protein
MRRPSDAISIGHARQQFPVAARFMFPQGGNAPQYDDSLRLPPLQTQLAIQSDLTPTSLPTPMDYRHSIAFASGETVESRARTEVEGQMGDVPFMEKIRMLSRISPPMPQSRTGSPTANKRGCVIAVEGDDKLLQAVGAYLRETLNADTGCAVKTWKARSTYLEQPESTTTSSDLSSPSSRVPTTPVNEEDPYVAYFNLISAMRIQSLEIKKHITTPSSHASPRPTPPTLPISPKRSTPIALLLGYSLTAVTHFASQISITDSYTSIEHWQWMASLLRGIIGPDLIVYCMETGKEEIERSGSIEVRECAGGQVVILVRAFQESTSREAEKDDGEGCEGIDEKTKRRLGFEIKEFVRSWSG